MASSNVNPDEVKFELEEKNNGNTSPQHNQVDEPLGKPEFNVIYEEPVYVHQTKLDHGATEGSKGSMLCWKVVVIVLSIAVVVLTVSEIFQITIPKLKVGFQSFFDQLCSYSSYSIVPFHILFFFKFYCFSTC